MKISSMLGVKLFKELEDNTIDLIRIVNMKKYADKSDPTEVTILNLGTNEKKKINIKELKGYTPLEPDGILTFSTVLVKDYSTGKLSKDVVITGNKFINMKFGDVVPYFVCRQSVTDVFYNLLCKTEDDMIAGLSVNRDNVPAGLDYGILLACDQITYSDYINFYRTDLLDDLLSMVKVNKFNTVLEDLYNEHAKAVHDPKLSFLEEHKGWCKNLQRLLHENNVQNDINEMLGITQVNFNISENIITKKLSTTSEDFTSVNDNLRYWLSSIYKLNISEIYITEFNHDINLAEYNDARYFILRDSENKLYLLVYTLDGEYKEEELEAKDKELDFSSKFRIDFYNKYHNKIK